MCCLSVKAVLFWKSRGRDRTGHTLLLYLFASAAWVAAFALGMLAPAGSSLASISRQAATCGLVILAVIFLSLTYGFLGQTSRFTRAWWILGIVSTLIVVLLTPEITPLHLSPISVGAYRIGQSLITRTLGALIGIGFTAAAVLATWRVYRETTLPLYRNRYRYWLLAIALLSLGDLFFITSITPLSLFGIGVRLGGLLLVTVAVLGHGLPDIKSLFRRALGYLAVALLATVSSIALVWASIHAAGQDWFYGVLISVGVASVVVSLVNNPARRTIQRFIDGRLFHIEADYQAALRGYAERVIETLELEPLADLVVSVLTNTTGARRGGLYLIREGKRDIGGMLLDPVCRMGGLPAGDLELGPDSVLAARLAHSGEPLTQYEIDLSEDFAGLATDERSWLQALAIEVLISIRTHAKPIGLIVLGAKRSDESYTSAEIEWLKALADQTAVALENARLFAQVKGMSVNVMRLNADLKRAYEKLQEVDRLKSAFIGMISHELRSPFAAASFSAQLLHRYAQERMYDELQDQIKQLDKELEEGRKMIDNVISFASLLSKQRELHLEETDIADLIRATISPLDRMAQARDIGLSLSLPSHLPPIRVDKTQLGEAVYHLVHNAIKFNREMGTVHVSCWATDAHIVFKVTDTGCGMPPEELAHIWEAFTQAADDVRRGVEGLGLGLALVKFVTEAHCGEVWAASKPGEGSTFGFRIPREAPSDLCSETT